LHKWLLISCLCLLSACNDNVADINEEYKTRLSAVINTPPAEPKLENVNFPKVHLSEPKHHISILELGSLAHCKLATLVAKRNNQLGKTQVPSERFKYQIRFLILANECLTDPLTTDESLKQTLAAAMLEKQQTLSDDFEYMLFNESELKGLLQLTSYYLPVDNKAYSSFSALEAITLLTSISEKIHRQAYSDIDPNSLTDALEKLHQNQFIKRLLSSARLQIAYNQQLTQWLSQFDYTVTVCQPGKNKNEAQILNAVFNKFYLNRIQGYQADLTGQLEKASPLLFLLLKNHEKIADLVDAQSQSSLLNQLKQTSKEHVIWWQNFYKACDIKPV
jgi:hypothetical protein